LTSLWNQLGSKEQQASFSVSVAKGKHAMITQTMVQPSSWVETGIELRKVRGLNLFKFRHDLQMRFEMLIEHQKANLLTPQETTELAGLTELERIFTLINARIIAES
jgi:hypothetical protein